MGVGSVVLSITWQKVYFHKGNKLNNSAGLSHRNICYKVRLDYRQTDYVSHGWFTGGSMFPPRKSHKLVKVTVFLYFVFNSNKSEFVQQTWGKTNLQQQIYQTRTTNHFLVQNNVYLIKWHKLWWASPALQRGKKMETRLLTRFPLVGFMQWKHERVVRKRLLLLFKK